MASSHLLLCFFFFSFCFLFNGFAGASPAPAIYVFGDSLADAGNNDHLTFSLLKADFPHNGVDYPGKKATGRFSNGKNAVDFLAEKLGLPSPPPYLSISSSSNKTQAFLHGINFASGGAGILDSTNKDQCITFSQQIEYYSAVFTALAQQLGSQQALAHLSDSVFGFVIGSNDIFAYKSNKNTPQQYVDSMISTLQGQLQKLYNLGARKFALIGAGPIGCCPSQRSKTKNGDCSLETNSLSVLYNKGATSLLPQMKSKLTDFSYSFFDTYSAFLQYIQNPAAYGFTDIKDACCGLGDMNAKIACTPISDLCENRKGYLFWDPFHPTEKTAELLAAAVVDGSSPYVFPVNLKQLSAL